jgi:hypothetical protein
MKSSQSFSPWRNPLLAAWVVLCLTACASVNESLGDLFLSSNAEAIGVLDGRVLRGRANFTGEREATFHLQSSDAPKLSCFGPLSYTATSTGLVNFACSDARSVLVEVHTLSQLTGTGRSRPGPAALALTYGLGTEKAAAYLGVAPERLIPRRMNWSTPDGER